MNDDTQVFQGRARSTAQADLHKRIIQDGVCPFCPENLTKYHALPIDVSTDYWIVTRNQYPYENTLVHALIISRRHVRLLTDLTMEEWLALKTVMHQSVNFYGLTGGGFVCRFGDPVLSGASVYHLHMHLIQPIPGKKVRVPIGTST